MEIRYGIVSTSSIAPRFIAAVREAGAGEVVALSSRSLGKAKDKAAEWGISKAYGSHAELMDDPDVNTVYISTVNSEHYELAHLAIEKGKNVICEKPCTTSSKETKKLFALAREKGVFLMEAQKMLFLPVITETARLIRDGVVGDVQMVEFSHSFSAGYNNWLFDSSLGGGTLLSSGIYALQFILHFFGNIKTIGGVCSRRADLAEHQYILSGETENGILFSIKNSTGAVLDNCAKIYGTKGRIDVADYWKARRAVIYADGKEPGVIEIPCKYELVYEAEHIKQCIDGGLLTSPVVTEALSVKGIEAIEGIKKLWDR